MRSKGKTSGEASSTLLKKLHSQDKHQNKSGSAESGGDHQQPVIVNVRDQIINQKSLSYQAPDNNLPFQVHNSLEPKHEKLDLLDKYKSKISD